MRTQITETEVKIWLSANDTDSWANRPHASWPCSQLEGKRVFAAFDSNGLYDLSINGKSGDCDANELNAIVCDHLTGKLPKEHPCYGVVVGQFLT